MDNTHEFTKTQPSADAKTLNIAYAYDSIDVLSEVAADRAWNISTEHGEGDMIWMQSLLSDESKQAWNRIKEFSLGKDTIISRMLGMEETCEKDVHADVVNIGLKFAPDSFAFTPRTWVYPRERSACEQFIAAKAREGKAPYYIVKPSYENNGNDICLIQTLDDIPEKLLDTDCVI